jgi:hypothetical protein
MGAGFNPSCFYVEIEGRLDEPRAALALQELCFFSSEVRGSASIPHICTGCGSEARDAWRAISARW